MNDLQNIYNKFYDYVIKSVENIEKKDIDIDECETYIIDNIACCYSVLNPIYLYGASTLRYNAYLQDDLNGDSITLRGKLYGDFIDEKYKLKFLEIVKKRDRQRLSILLEDVVHSIINMRR